MKKLSIQLYSIIFALAGLLGASTALSQETRDVSKYNLYVEGENLNRFDPVSYFPEGGGVPALGLLENSLNYLSVTYFFSTVENRDLFLTNPNKYEPTYGQWCAYAMASGASVKINPKHYTISGHRLHFFVSKRAKANFDADVLGHEEKADENWKNISGEDARK